MFVGGPKALLSDGASRHPNSLESRPYTPAQRGRVRRRMARCGEAA